MKYNLHHPKSWYICALFAADVLFFGLTDPANVPSFALIIGFLLFATTLYQLVIGGFKLGAWYGLKFSRRQKRLAQIITGVVAGTVALQSMGQLRGRDVLVLIPLALVVYLYVAYSQTSGEAIAVRE